MIFLFLIYFRFKVVVTQKAKKEMANAEKAAQKKLNQKTKLGNLICHNIKYFPWFKFYILRACKSL